MILRMLDSRGSSKARFQWSRAIGGAVLVFFAVEVAFAFGRKLLVAHQISVRLAQTQEELKRLQKQNLQLKLEKEALFRPEKIERLARAKLGLTKPNEIAVEIIQKEPQPAQSSPAEGKTHPPPKGLWEKLKEELPLSWLLKSGRS